jgi:hypothetical protein
MAEIAVAPYGGDVDEEWNAFVAASRNGTFLLDRRYMDYHADRFTDASLVFRDGGRIAAVLPANRAGDRLVSHGGLTYGGLVLAAGVGQARVDAIFRALIGWARAEGIAALRYKTIPSIYHAAPAEEDRYTLFRLGARLVRRDPLTVVAPHDPPQPSELRRRTLRKIAARGTVTVARSEDWAGYWAILAGRLAERYEARPTHDLAEIRLLAGRFPEAIRLVGGFLDGRMVAGVVLYETATAVHAQYIASDEDGRAAGALDAVFATVIAEAGGSGRWFDFGISTERDGLFLNEGLIGFKESFGGRTVVHDIYELGPLDAVDPSQLDNRREDA